MQTRLSSVLIDRAHRNTALASLFAYASFSLMLQIFPPFLSAIGTEFHVNHSTASLLMTIFLAPVVITALPAGSLVDRYGSRLVGLTAFPIMIIGGFISILLPNFDWLLIGRAVSGFGAALLLVSVIKTLTTFPRDKHGLAFGLFIVGLPIGTAVDFDVLASFNRWLGWRADMLIIIAVIALVMATFARLVHPLGPHTRNATSGSINYILRNRPMLRLSLAVILGYTAIIGFTTWAPSTLVSFAHIPLWLASMIASILLLIDIPLGPFWGLVSDRLGKRKFFIVLSFLIYLLGSILVPFVAGLGSLIVAVALIGTVAFMGSGCAMFFPAALTVPASMVSDEFRGAAYGMFFTAQCAGMLLGPLLIGYAIDLAPIYGFFSVSLATFAGLLASLLVKSP